MTQDQAGNVPLCFLEACDVLAGEAIEPSKGEMSTALLHEYVLDDMNRTITATAPTGETYVFDLNRVEDAVSLPTSDNHVAWLVWLTLQSLAGLEDDMTRNQDNRRYIRTYSDGTKTVRARVEGMFFKE